MLAFFLLINIMIFGAFIAALLKGSEPPAEFRSNMNDSQFINTTVEVYEEKSGFTYVSNACKGQLDSKIWISIPYSRKF